jgi:hypothetical protein
MASSGGGVLDADDDGVARAVGGVELRPGFFCTPDGTISSVYSLPTERLQRAR